MYYDSDHFNKISVRISGTDRNKTLKFIEKIWQNYNITDYPFTYEYLNDRYNRLYKSVSNMRTIFSYFMFLAISIAILGMVGLSIFIIERRTKEIGIRKVTGARVSEILIMLNKDFLKWVFIAFIVACPISWYAMHKWLQGFAYKTELNWWIFGLAGILALGIALITVSWQSWRAATRNPVEALRYE